jgi:hypothetical protein
MSYCDTPAFRDSPSSCLTQPTGRRFLSGGFSFGADAVINFDNIKLTGPLFTNWTDYAVVCGIAVAAMFVTVFLIRFVATIAYFLLPIGVALLAVIVLNDPAGIQIVVDRPNARYILPALVGVSGAGTFLFLGLFAFNKSDESSSAISGLQQTVNNLRAEVENLRARLR